MQGFYRETLTLADSNLEKLWLAGFLAPWFLIKRAFTFPLASLAYFLKRSTSDGVLKCFD